MDTRQIEEIVKAINKSQTAKEPPENTINLLKRLRTGVKPTEELLRATKVGVFVNRLKSNEDKDVAKLASEMVSNWRNSISKAKAGGGTPRPSNGASTNGTASPAPSDKPKLSVPADKRTHKSDTVDMARTGDSTRDACCGLIYDGLAFMNSTTGSNTILRQARAVEQAVFDANKRTTSQDYKSKMRSLFQNLKNKSNPKLRENVLSGAIPPERFATMTSDEMKSEERKKEEEKMKKDNMNNAMVAKEEVSISGSIECGKCKQKKVSYTQAQTRSADEPMTTFYTCQNCGNRWKYSG